MVSRSIINAISVLLFTVFTNHAASNPIQEVSRNEQASAVTYMMTFGHLKLKDPRLGMLRTKKELENAIEGLQRFAGIEVTGKIDAATVELIKTPRCGIPDFGPTDNMRRRRRYALQGSKWEKLDLTYKIMNQATKRTITKTQISTTIRKAFAMWASVTPLRFTEIQHDGVADIVILFRMGSHDDGYPFDGPGGTLAHGFYPHNNIGYSGDVHFDDDETWVLENSSAGGTDFLWTAVHEIGHAIGLDHSDYKLSVMYPFYRGYRANLQLYEDDITGIQMIYGKPPTQTPVILPSTSTKAPVDPSDGPSPCQTSFDAVFHSKDGNTYFFKNSHFWKLDQYNRVSEALSVVEHWPHLRGRVQAAYTRRDGKTIFFKGKRFWVYEGTKYIQGPMKINDYGLPLELKRLDAVFVWGGNGKTYFFKGHQYWRYNEKNQALDPGYPRNISVGWGAMPSPIDSVMKWKDGNSYFFHGLKFQKYDFYNRHEYKPTDIGRFFMGCSNVGAAKDGVERATVLTSLVAFLAVVAGVVNF